MTDDKGTTQTATEKLSYSIAAAAAATDLSRSTIYNLVGEGRLRLTRIGRRSVIPASSLRALVEGEAA